MTSKSRCPPKMMLKASLLDDFGQFLEKNSKFLLKSSKNLSQIFQSRSKIYPKVVVKSQTRSKRAPNADLFDF